ncbi:MAG: 4-alpha-glucanotransferase [Actinobacteria bacterium]|nr:4-alpha-glucanotransferase [Actinomycetota bacterium]
MKWPENGYCAAVPATDAHLRTLADAYGVATEYWDQAGARVDVSDATVRAILHSLGVDTDSAEAIEAAIAELPLRHWRRFLPPFFITREGEGRRAWMHVPHGDPARMWVELADGYVIDLAQMDVWVDPVDVDGVLTGEASFWVPDSLPIGYHTLHAVSRARAESCDLAVAPARLHPERILGQRQWGLMTQVYSLRSHASWAMGDLHDLGDLAAWSARELGAGFVLVNPLHACSPVSPVTPSPYSPVTRRFASPLYVRVEDIPEWNRVPDRGDIEKQADALRAANTTPDLLERDPVWAVKRAALERTFAVSLDAERQREFDAYLAQEGVGLIDYARWCALADRYGPITDDWPAEFRHPRSAAVSEFARTHADDVNFHLWMQWVTYQQLAAAQRAAVDAGMVVGVVNDLAVGVHRAGADAWALQDVIAPGVMVGAPPDMYNQMGQDWQLPPWRPEALADHGFRPLRDMLRTVPRTSGGLRVDHVLGLFRMWWIPEGSTADHGTFVRFDHDALLGILCLEAHLAGAVVIGEDLGTVEDWVQRELASRGILGTSILWFEPERDSRHWRRDVLASVAVHDLPPTAGYLRDEHVRIRSELGLLSTDSSTEYTRARVEREEWAKSLIDQGYLNPSVDLETDTGLEEMLLALHRALEASAARMIGIAVTDVVRDRRAQNQPGTDQEYPNWRVPLCGEDGTAVLLEEFMADPQAVRTLVLGR